MATRKPPRVVEASITDYTKDGFGLGNGITDQGHELLVEVPFTMPGDLAEASVFKKRKGRYQARMTALVNPSADRIEPRCAHFGVCGGCRWQHLSYSEQLKIKERTVHATFEGLITDDTVVHPMVSCDSPWQYRNKMEFSFSSNLAGEQFLGLMMIGGNRRVINLNECHLVSDWYIEALSATRVWWQGSGLEAYHASKDKGSLRTLTLREGIYTGDRLAMLTVSGNPEYALNRQQIDAWKNAMVEAISPKQPDARLALFMRIHQAAKGMRTSFYEMHLGGPDHILEHLHLYSNRPEPLVCKVSPSAFFQPNTKQAEKLYSRAMQLAKLSLDMVVYDLYCGTGTLGLAAAPYVSKVIGIELSHEAVLDARSNAVQNGIANAEFFHGDVATILTQFAQEGVEKKPGLVIVDPPRVGLGDKTIKLLLSLQPEQVLYVSCNPNSQAADIRQLIQGGYELLALQPVDQFPHTIHLENIALLRKRSAD